MGKYKRNNLMRSSPSGIEFVGAQRIQILKNFMTKLASIQLNKIKEKISE